MDWTIFLAMTLAAALLGAAKLAVAVHRGFARAGVGGAMALGGQFRTLVFAASFVPIASYVVTFLLVFRRVRGNTVANME